MAANKRPRKKYSPKRNPFAACRYAHFVPKLAVSNEPLALADTLMGFGKSGRNCLCLGLFQFQTVDRETPNMAAVCLGRIMAVCMD